MYIDCQNVQHNHVAINDCDKVFRMAEPRGDRACIWVAEDGTDHALVGLAHEDLVVKLDHGADGSYRAILARNDVVILRPHDSFYFDPNQNEVVETPLGALIYDRFARFDWVLEEGVWRNELNTENIDWFYDVTFDSETGVANAKILLISHSTQAVTLDPHTRTISYGQIQEPKKAGVKVSAKTFLNWLIGKGEK